MKFVRYGEKGLEKLGVLDAAGKIRNLSDEISDLTADTLEQITSLKINPEEFPEVEGNPRLGACIGKVGKLIAIGLNYADHAAETGVEVPPEPIIFMKATSSICGAFDNILLPHNSEKTDWEVELGVIIGKETKYATEENAMDSVAGYCVVNDVSERDFQLKRKGQWVKGKSYDNFAPIGPWFVTKDEIADPQNLGLFLSVNGEAMQQGSTKTMVYKVPYLISYISQFMSLQAGDIISTGTPPGVGMGKNPPQYLKEGDCVNLKVEGLGEQKQKVVKDR